MKKIGKTFLLLLLTAFLTTSKVEAQVYCLSESQVVNIALAYDSLDECREVNDSLQSQINSALTVIQADSTLINNLYLLSSNQGEIISGKDILLIDEKKISSAYRNRYRLWKIAAIVLGGLTVYQSVK